METAVAKTYQYEPVSLERHESRLVTLYPGYFDEDIRIHLDMLDMSLPPGKMPKYDALSYAWGANPKIDKSVTIIARPGHPGGVLPISRSLDTALRHLRFKENPRLLWTDFISINQATFDEKNYQVGWMDEVYKKAHRVVIFLGTASAADFYAMDLLASIGESVNITGQDVDLVFEPAKRISKMRLLPLHARAAIGRLCRPMFNLRWYNPVGFHCPEVFEHNGDEMTALRMSMPETEAVVGLLQRSWFSRLWIVQESRLMADRNRSMLQCGERVVSWEQFCKGVIAFQFLTQRDMLSKKYSDPIKRRLRSNMMILCNTTSKISIYNYRELHKFGCVNPRDRLYGILSIVRDDLPYKVTVNYKRSAEDIFEELQRREIPVNGLWLLTYCHLDPRGNPERDPLLHPHMGPEDAPLLVWDGPSWVPNQLSFPSYLGDIPIIPTIRFSPHCEFIGDKSLRVFGFRMAVVETITEYPDLEEEWSPDDGPASMLNWLQRVASGLGENGNVLDNDASGRQVAKRIMQILDATSTQGFFSERTLNSGAGLTRAVLLGFFDRFPSKTPAQRDDAAKSVSSPYSVYMLRIYNALKDALDHPRRPVSFKTDTDEVGYGPASALPGDQVCAVFGCDRALLLRPKGGAEYAVVGPVAVSGGLACEPALGALPKGVVLVHDPAEDKSSFYDVGSRELVRDPRLGKFGLGELVGGLPDTYLRRGDIDVEPEELRRRGLPVESFVLV